MPLPRSSTPVGSTGLTLNGQSDAVPTYVHDEDTNG